MNDETHDDDSDKIAVIGMAGRFPGAKNIDEFWQNLKSGTESITSFSDKELLDNGIEPEVLSDPNYVKSKGFLDNADQFDAAFFGFSAKEAEITDPQQRLLLECAWEALEHAGYCPEKFSGSIAVYAGVGGFDSYLNKNICFNEGLRKSVGDYQITLSNNSDYACTRIAYKLNLKGPAITVQTACSTSLMSIIMGYQSLLDYQCDIAMAGGSAITLPVKSGYLYQEGMIMSPDGHCRPFDAQAQGTLSGNGAGIVVLKRLEDAIEDGDTIHAVIRGAALNNDGSHKMGYTAPSIDGQADVITEALTLSDVTADTIGYVEAHGTGTPLGDPIELAALTQAYRKDTTDKQYCALGSVKSNIGHLDVASGVCSFIKTVLMLKHRQIPPSLHFETPNPKMNIENSPFFVNTKLSEWVTDQLPRRAGVSSFGIGGTNAHVILEEAPTLNANQSSQPSCSLILLSAKTATALKVIAKQFSNYLTQHPDISLADAAYTQQIGRTEFSHRCYAVCQTHEDAINAFKAEAPNPEVIASKTQPPVTFMFSGQGSQYVNMGLGLYQTEPFFKEQVDFCAEYLQPHLNLDIRLILYPTDSDTDSDTNDALRNTSITQPALFVIEYATAMLWIKWGVQPNALIGHSIGEYVAACLAGVITLEQALTLVAMRGKLIQSLPEGSMLAVPLSEEDIQPYLTENLNLAAINVLSQSVVSGTAKAVAECIEQLEKNNIPSTQLQTSHAFHSNMMSPILDAFLQEVKKFQFKKPTIPFVSNVTGLWIKDSEATDPAYWVKHLRQPVRFSDGLKRMFEDQNTIFLEVGPGRTLSTFARKHPDYIKGKRKNKILSSLRHPKDDQLDHPFFLDTLGKLWTSGLAIKWASFFEGQFFHRIPLPTYPFERKTYWVKPVPQNATMQPNLSLKKGNTADWFYKPTWFRKSFETMPKLEEKTNWLIFCHKDGFSDQVCSRLKQAGMNVTYVSIGKDFCNTGQGHYQVNPSHHGDFDSLLKALCADNSAPDYIVYAWTMTKEHECLSHSILLKSQDVCFYSLIYLAQAIGKSNITKHVDIKIVSNYLQSVTGDELLSPQKAILLGPCKVIPTEYQNISCKSIDLAVDSSIDLFFEEYSDQQNTDKVVAFRGRHRWVQDFTPVQLIDSVNPVKLKMHGVYLITGGLGGIGLALAEYLAVTYQAKLVLIGRTHLPLRKQETDVVSDKWAAISQLEKLGSEVMLASADIANIDEMNRVVDDAKQKFGLINGVIHAAGVAGSGVIQLKNAEEAAKVLSAKVFGTVVLEQIFHNTDLDFMLLCSSITSILAEMGQVDYCAANAFLDAFSHYHRNVHKIPTICLNWDAWQKIGMAVTTKVPDNLKSWQSENVKKGLLPQEGIDVFKRAIECISPQIIVSTYDLHYRYTEDSAFQASATPEEPTLSEESAHSRPDLTNDYHLPTNDNEKIIVDQWQRFLGVKPIGISDDFFQLGGDSLLAIQVVNQLKTFFPDATLNSHSLLAAPTPRQLADIVTTSSSALEEYPPVLVNIQQGNKDIKPLFLMHPVGGHVYIYKDMAHALGKNQPVYGLQAQGLDGKNEPLTSVSDMAKQYISAIQTVQNEGPYYLGGSSFGGTLAYEMAQQLRMKDQKTSLIIMIDTPSPDKIPPMMGSDIEVLAYLMSVGDDASFSSSTFQAMPFEQQINYFLEHGKAAKQLLPDTDTEQLLLYLKLFKLNQMAMEEYVASRYPGKIIFFKCLERDNFNPTDPETGWAKLATEGFEVHTTPGNHITMNYKPNVDVIAKQLLKHL